MAQLLKPEQKRNRTSQITEPDNALNLDFKTLDESVSNYRHKKHFIQTKQLSFTKDKSFGRTRVQFLSGTILGQTILT